MSQELIEIKPNVANGKPVVKGTRITVQSVLELIADGDSVEEVLLAYPSITGEQVWACVERAARAMGNRYSALPLA